jgi:DNA-binding protein HU-beta
VTKNELIEVIVEKTGQNRKTVSSVVEEIFDTIAAELLAGNEIHMRGFGRFYVKDLAARTARNPQTGEVIEIAAQRKPAFKASKDLTTALNNREERDSSE